MFGVAIPRDKEQEIPDGLPVEHRLDTIGVFR